VKISTKYKSVLRSENFYKIQINGRLNEANTYTRTEALNRLPRTY